MRKIIHCDCDCFYAAVEMRDEPRLRDQALAIGGKADQRGVIATCNYAARKFGVRSAMPTAHAMRLCPQLIVLPPNMEKYRQASRQIFEIYAQYTDLVEPLSLDEAYLDVSQTRLHKGSATLIAQEIRARVAQTIGITVSAGVAPNKFLAKIASDWNKPDGLFVILPDQVSAFVSQLPVARLFGVGKVTAAKLNGMGIHTCHDLLSYSLPDLMRQFGKLGNTLYLLCRGIDQREVIVSSERKSISVEETYAQDLPDYPACLDELPALFAALQTRIERAQCAHLKQKVYVKIRFSDFRQTTVEAAGSELSQSVCAQLLQTAYLRFNQPVRLLGLGIRLADPQNPQQLSLFS